jgi:hypothetical protein
MRGTRSDHTNPSPGASRHPLPAVAGRGEKKRRPKLQHKDIMLWLYTCRASISFLISAIALAGLSPLGQVLVQLRMVWQR